MNATTELCARCKHPKSEHHGGRGKCVHWAETARCLCTCYHRTKWDKWQPAKVGTQPAVVRFRVHNNPTKWSVNVGKKVELQIRDTGETVTGVVNKVNPDGYAFIELF